MLHGKFFRNRLYMIGTSELLLIAIVILLIFGGKKIPELMRGLGQGVRSFKKGMNEDIPDSNINSIDNEVKLPEESKELNGNE